MAMTRVDVTFTEQRLRVQLNLQQVQGSVQVDRVEPQSAAHGRVAPGATLVAVNGERIRPLIGRQAWVAFCERVKNTPRPMTLTFEQPAPARPSVTSRRSTFARDTSESLRRKGLTSFSAQVCPSRVHR